MTVGGEELQSCHQSGLGFVCSYRRIRELCWRGSLQACLSKPISGRLLQGVGGAHVPRAVPSGPRHAPSAVAPPRRGRGLSRLLARLVGAWLPLGSCLLRPPASDCPLRWPLSPSSCLQARGCRGQSERASREPRLPRAGNGAPELQHRLEPPARCGRWGRLQLLLLPAAAAAAAAGPSPSELPSCLEAPPSGSPWRRHLAERWGRGLKTGLLQAGPLGHLARLGVRRLGPTEDGRTCKWRGNRRVESELGTRRKRTYR